MQRLGLFIPSFKLHGNNRGAAAWSCRTTSDQRPRLPEIIAEDWQRFGFHNLRLGLSTFLTENGQDPVVLQRILLQSHLDMAMHSTTGLNAGLAPEPKVDYEFSMRAVKGGILYFVVVFGTGFLLGPIRIFWVVPRLGARTAELLEAPIMLAVSIAAARWIVRWLAVPPRVSGRLGMGLIALALMLVAEFSLVLRLRGISIREYMATRDPVSGTVYYLTLAVFAILPMMVRRRR